MSKAYKIEIIKNVVYTASIEVDAADENEAYERGEALLEQGDISWTYVEDDIEIQSVE